MSLSSVTTSNSLDTTQDVATLLRLGTAEDHEKAQHWAGARLLTGGHGKLSKESYIRYLIILWHVYTVLENALDAHSSHPVLSHTYNPRLLSRASGLSADIAYLLQTPEGNWKDHPFVLSFNKNLPSEAKDYITALQYTASSDPSKLLAHSYVRYLGDLSGGQIIKRNIRKIFDIAEDDNSGVQMYYFEKLDGRGPATIGDIRTIKGWFRDSLNDSVGDDAHTKMGLVEEAKHVYRLNKGILSLLREESGEPGYNSDDSEIKSQALKSPAWGISITNIISLILLLGVLYIMMARAKGAINLSFT